MRWLWPKFCTISYFRKPILSKSWSMFRKCSQKNNQILWAQSPITILSMHLTSNFNSFLQWSLFTNFTCFTIDASILFSKRFLHNMKYYQIFVKRNFPRCAQILGKRHIDYNASWETARIEQYLERLTLGGGKDWPKWIFFMFTPKILCYGPL